MLPRAADKATVVGGLWARLPPVARVLLPLLVAPVARLLPALDGAHVLFAVDASSAHPVGGLRALALTLDSSRLCLVAGPGVGRAAMVRALLLDEVGAAGEVGMTACASQCVNSESSGCPTPVPVRGVERLDRLLHRGAEVALVDSTKPATPRGWNAAWVVGRRHGTCGTVRSSKLTKDGPFLQALLDRGDAEGAVRLVDDLQDLVLVRLRLRRCKGGGWANLQDRTRRRKRRKPA